MPEKGDKSEVTQTKEINFLTALKTTITRIAGGIVSSVNNLGNVFEAARFPKFNVKKVILVALVGVMAFSLISCNLAEPAKSVPEPTQLSAPAPTEIIFQPTSTLSSPMIVTPTGIPEVLQAFPTPTPVGIDRVNSPTPIDLGKIESPVDELLAGTPKAEVPKEVLFPGNIEAIRLQGEISIINNHVAGNVPIMLFPVGFESSQEAEESLRPFMEIMQAFFGEGLLNTTYSMIEDNQEVGVELVERLALIEDYNQAYALMELVKVQTGIDYVFVAVVNSSKYIGSGGQVPIIPSGNEMSYALFGHEVIAHALGGLDDEGTSYVDCSELGVSHTGFFTTLTLLPAEVVEAIEALEQTPESTPHELTGMTCDGQPVQTWYPGKDLMDALVTNDTFLSLGPDELFTPLQWQIMLNNIRTKIEANGW